MTERLVDNDHHDEIIHLLINTSGSADIVENRLIKGWFRVGGVSINGSRFVGNAKRVEQRAVVDGRRRTANMLFTDLHGVIP